MPKRKKQEAKSAEAKRPNTAITFTAEQEAILQTDLAPGEVLVIQAIAGSGKTATLLEYMLRRPSEQFLYLTFNVDAAKQGIAKARAMGLKNVICMTINALAHKDNTISFKKKTKAEFIVDWKQWLAAEGPSMAQTHEHAQVPANMNAVWKAINRYAQSDASEIAGREDIVRHAVQLWTAIESRRLHCPSFEWHCKFFAEHHCLLGDFDLSDVAETNKKKKKPTSQAVQPEDEPVKQAVKQPVKPVTHLIVDEAQDINWPMLKMIMNQIHAPVAPVAILFCGDPYQHLYSFRHCISVFSDVDFCKRFGIAPPRALQLSKSVRFGPAIAQAATGVLDRLVGSHPKAVIGTLNELRDDTVKRLVLRRREIKPLVESLLLDHSGDLGILCRTNEELFCTFLALDGIDCKCNSKHLNELTKLYKLFVSDRPAFTRKYSQTRWATEHADPEEKEDDEGGQLYLYAYINNTPQSQVQQVVERITKMHLLRKYRCNLSTVHRAKGLEYDSVLLSQDIAEHEAVRRHHYNKEKEKHLDGHVNQNALQRQEKALNDFYFIYYTGITRAKYGLWVIQESVEGTELV